MVEKFKQFINFLTGSLWRVTEDEVSHRRYRNYNLLKIIYVTIQRYVKDRVWLRGAVLTYTTLFSIIPILAILFSIAKGFGFSNLMEKMLREGIAIQSEVIDTVMSFIDRYLEHVQSGLFIGIGVGLLLWAIIKLTSSIETNTNAVWDITKQRSYFRKFTDYFALFLLLPIFIVCSATVSIFMTTIYHRMEDYLIIGSFVNVLIKLAPFLLSSIAFITLYAFIPNTKVKFAKTIIPGILAGCAFQAFFYFYINVQVKVSSYNAIYGSFAIIPMFMLWANISWCIYLFGVEMCYVTHNIEQFNFGQEVDNVSRRYHDFLCVLIMSMICKRFEEGGTPYTANELSQEGKVPIRLTNILIDELEKAKILYTTAIDAKAETPHYLPGIDTNQLSVGKLLSTLESEGCEDFKVDYRERAPKVWEAFMAHRDEQFEKANSVLLKDL